MNQRGSLLGSPRDSLGHLGAPRDPWGLLWAPRGPQGLLGSSRLILRTFIGQESGELEEAINENHQESIKEEIGDLLMIMTNLAQKLNVDSEDALISANKKFTNRFAYIETALENEGTGFSEASFEQLDSLWEDSKKLS